MVQAYYTIFNIRKMVNNSQHCKNMANHENPQHDLNISHLCYLQFRLLLWQENAWHARKTTTRQCTTKPQFLLATPLGFVEAWICNHSIINSVVLELEKTRCFRHGEWILWSWKPTHSKQVCHTKIQGHIFLSSDRLVILTLGQFETTPLLWYL